MSNHITFTLDEIIDPRLLQTMQDDFSESLKMKLIIVSRTGESITGMSTFNECQAKYNQGDEDFWLAKETPKLLEKNWREFKPAWLRHSNEAITAAVPIIFADQYLGSWLARWVPDAIEMESNDGSFAALKEREVNRLIDCLSTFSETVMGLVLKNWQLRQNIKRLDTGNKRLQTFVDASETPMYVCDFQNGEILMVNQAFCRQLGLEADMLLGEKCWKANGSSENGFCSFCPKDSLIVPDQNSTRAYVWEYYNEKLGRWLKCTNKTLYWDSGRLAHMVTQVDITQEHKLRNNLVYAAYYDRYTNLPNNEKLAVDLREIKNDVGIDSLHLLCVDLKALRQFNRIFGKKNGYRLFSQMADWLKSLGSGLTVYHAEGYKLCVLVSNQNLRYSKNMAQTIVDRFKGPWRIEINGQSVSHYCAASVAVICLSPGFVYHDIYDLVERTLRSAEERNSLLIYDEEADRAEKQCVHFEITLKNHVSDGMKGFAVHYQPIVDVQAGIWKGVEALCRWTLPETGEAVSPGKFIPEAERLGLIGTIGEWVLEESISQCKSLNLDELDDFFLSVNLSFLQIMDDGFAERVAAMLARYQYPGTKLALEVTESMEFHFNDYTISVVDNLRSLGIRITLDDFGSGYASFNYLKNLPAKFVKTERDFILDIEQDVHMQYFYYILSELAHMNGMKLIAEGIESRNQLEIVKNNGADYIQGYYYSKPLNKDQLGDCLIRFRQPDPCHRTEDSHPVNLQQWLNCSNAYMVTPKLFLLLNQCIEILFAEQELQPLLESILEILGRHFGVCRSFAYMYDGGDTSMASFFWCGKDLEPFALDIDEDAKIKAIAFLHNAFQENGMLISPDISDLPPWLFDILNSHKTRSILILPMQKDDKTIGFVGFDDVQYREWASNEVIMLWNLARILGTSVEQIKLKRDAIQKKGILSDVLNATGLNVMVCDIETTEILWVNDTFRSNYAKNGTVIGRKCCELVQGKNERCSYCKVPELLKKDRHGSICHKHYNEKWNRSFIVYDSLIQWDNGKQAHIEYFLDVTEHDQLYKELEYFTSVDTLTGALKRDKLVEKLEGHLADWDKRSDFTVALVDVDNLKAVNLQYGYQAGDKYLSHMVSILKKSFAHKDVVGRIGSDGFLLLLPGLDKKKAESLMETTYAEVQEIRFASTPDLIMSFSYAIVDLTDLESGAKQLTAIDILERAEGEFSNRFYPGAGI